ncbi:MAG: GNAT family N-acetyltransferase, partial [Nitrospirae bacterium]
IAEKDGEPVGFLGMMPDFNLVLRKMRGRITPLSILKALYYQRKIEDLRLLLLGVRPEYRLRGVDALLFREGFKGAKRYKRVEFSWILEDNLPVIRLVEMIGGKRYKVFRIYQKIISKH